MADSLSRILLVSGSESDRERMRRLLAGATMKCEIVEASSIAHALRVIHRISPMAALVDLELSDGDASELLRACSSNASRSEPPISPRRSAVSVTARRACRPW